MTKTMKFQQVRFCHLVFEFVSNFEFRYSACPGATSLEQAVSPIGQVWARDFA